MPVYNGAATLAAAVRSVILQSYQNWELLLFDDGSSDSTLAIAQSFTDPRIRVISDGKNMGLPTRLNQAIDMARGQLLARMDGDDVCYSQRLQRQVEYLQANADTDLLGTAALVFRGDGEVCGLFPSRITHADICRRVWAGFYLPHPTWMGRIEWFRKHRYRAAAVRSEDQDLLLRSYRHSKFACLPEVLLGYRQDKPSLRNLLMGRRSFARAAMRELTDEGRYAVLPLIIAEQAAKGIADFFALGLGMAPLLHRHRALPLRDPAMLRHWERQWSACTEDANEAPRHVAAHAR